LKRTITIVKNQTALDDRRRPWWAVCGALMLLTGCGALPNLPSFGSKPPPAPAPAPAPAVAQQAPTAEPAAPAPAPESIPPMSQAEIARALSEALVFLETGQEEQALAELRGVIQSEPGNRLAQSLMRQITEDPVALLGRESFTYRVQPGESLSRIAQRFLGDVHLFYALARYNNIKIPRNVAGGQALRVPGKAPPPAPPAPPAQPPSPPPGPTTTPPPAPPPVTKADPAAAAKEAERQRAELIARHTRTARAAFAKQDLDGAIRAWDAVLELDPDSRTAVIERQKVVGLKERLSKVK
jgi:hypothetical protein